MLKRTFTFIIVFALLISTCFAMTSCQEGELTAGTYETRIGGILDKFVFEDDGNFLYSFDDMEFEGTYEIFWGAFKDEIKLNFSFENLTDKEESFAATLTAFESPVSFEVGDNYIVIAEVKYKFVD